MLDKRERNIDKQIDNILLLLAKLQLSAVIRRERNIDKQIDNILLLLAKLQLSAVISFIYYKIT